MNGIPDRAAHPMDIGRPVELSVVMPCLNEADTLGTCVAKAQQALHEHGIAGEIIIADNGSTDGSQEIARKLGASVIHVEQRGYGAALQGGIAAARGRYILMGDADDSYDFTEIPKFVAKLREGYELVQGCRLPRGGGRVMPGAMPFLHRWWGNPMFSMLARWWFSVPINDIYCGMRAFTRQLIASLEVRSNGMIFATEMILQASRAGARIAEVPITLHPDGRKSHPPHLKTFRDGWRTLRFFLLSTPRWLFLQPGKLLLALGAAGFLLSMPQVRMGGIEFGLNTLVFASLAILCGMQAVLFALGTKTLSVRLGMLPPDARMKRFLSTVTLERGLTWSATAMVLGGMLLGTVVLEWGLGGFGAMDHESSLRLVIPGATLAAVGLQGIFASFFVAALGAFEQRLEEAQHGRRHPPIPQPQSQAA